ncbi:MAG TPA: sugar ABC transporter permease [Candidatus Mediterraneibacter excrementigallinarum]|nr:sugar ABC transporter permease [Candidatus Mediterraneibacter excrementigallinarum]
MKKKSSLGKARERAGLLFVLPSMTILTIFVFIPLIISFVFSFFKFDMMFNNFEFQKLDNYIRLFQDGKFFNALWNTVYYTVCTVPVQIMISLIVAILIKKQSWFNSFCKTVFFIPAICSMTVISIIWSFLINKDIGMFSYWLELLGFEMVDLLNSPVWAMPTVILVGIWKNLGFYMVILLAGLNGIDESYYEAAVMDGAGAFQKFRKITIPMMMPTLSFTVVNCIIGSFQVFDQVYVMTKGGPLFKTQTLVQLIYSTAFESFDMGYASTIAVALFAITFVVSVLTFKHMTREEDNIA